MLQSTNRSWTWIVPGTAQSQSRAWNPAKRGTGMSDSWFYASRVYKIHRDTERQGDLCNLMNKLGHREHLYSDCCIPTKSLIPDTAPC